MPTTNRVVALNYDELAEIRESIEHIEPPELGRLIKRTRFDCKAENILHGVGIFPTTSREVTDTVQALFRDHIDLYLEDQTLRVQQDVLLAIRRLKTEGRIPAVLTPLRDSMSEDAFLSMSGQDDSQIEQSDDNSTSEGHRTPSTITDASSPLRSNDMSLQYDVFNPEPYHGLAGKARLGSGSLFGDDSNADSHDEEDVDDEFVDIDALSCVSDKRTTPPIESIEEAPSFRSTSVVDLSQDCTSDIARLGDQSLLGDDEHENDGDAFLEIDTMCCASAEHPVPSIEPVEPADHASSRATSVVDPSGDYECSDPQIANLPSQPVSAQTDNQSQREQSDLSIHVAKSSRTGSLDAIPEEDIPPRDSPYASDYGFAAQGAEHDLDQGPAEISSEDGDDADLDSLPGRPMTTDLLSGKTIDNQSSIDLLASLNSRNLVSTPEQRSARRISPTVMPDATGATSHIAVVNGIPTPLTGSFASGVSRDGFLNNNQESPTPAARFAEKSRRTPTPEPLYRSRYRRRRKISDSPESQPPSSPSQPIDLTSISEQAQSRPATPAGTTGEDLTSPNPMSVEEEEEDDDDDDDDDEEEPDRPTLQPRERPGRMFSLHNDCLLYTSPSPRDRTRSRMPSSA